MEIETDLDKIPIDEELSEFANFLSINKKCIFSAKFGDGKSSFISEFIEKHSDKYIFIPIYPVDYQVADNKDIFEYIKRDILLKLLSTKGIYIDNIDIGFFAKACKFIKKKKFDLTQYVLESLTVLNIKGLDIDLGKLIESCKKIKDDFDESTITEKDQAISYLEDFKQNKGGIYEFDIISNLIKTIISRCQEDDSFKKEIVLIIEDLDRIDPAHIFRILNIFSAHFDSGGVKWGEERFNKFGFDRIITVGHYDNLENIYHHVYGKETDFDGYISKFSTSKPFKYSLKDKISKFIYNNIDERLDNYPKIKQYLAQDIASKVMENTTENKGISLRNLKSNLLCIPYIKDCKRSLNIRDYLVSHHKNDLAIYLDLIKRFDISLDDHLDSEDYDVEMVRLIGVGWIFSEVIDMKDITVSSIFSFIGNGFKVFIKYNKGNRGMSQFTQIGPYYLNMDEREAISIDFRVNNDREIINFKNFAYATRGIRRKIFELYIENVLIKTDKN